jgi:hypothetical protein
MINDIRNHQPLPDWALFASNLGYTGMSEGEWKFRQGKGAAFV